MRLPISVLSCLIAQLVAAASLPGQLVRINEDFSRELRKAGAVFNRFGLANVRRGGHSVEFYLDDLTYTADRASDSRRTFVPQTTVEVPYPHEQGGRRY